METEAINLIFSKVKGRFYQIVKSPVHIKEIEAIRDEVERIQLMMLLDEYGKDAGVNLSKARKRAEELADIGFGIADAAHVAFAEEAKAEFISCDKKLVKKCIRHKIEVWCGNALSFCEKEDLK